VAKQQEKIRVLIAEDDYLVAEMIKGLVQEAGYVVVGEASNGEEAIDKTCSLRPDVVLMDIRMPDLDGIEATHRIQEECPTPVIILTAYETPELVERATEAGVAAYLIKPPDLRELDRSIGIAIARFQDLMEVRRLNQELAKQNEELAAFAHTVAHDLQNPLALIIGFAEAVRRYHPTMSKKEFEESLEIIERTGRKMSRTIEELLLLAQVREEDVELEVLDMGTIVAEVVHHRLAHMVRKYQAEILLPDQWPEALGYGPWIEEVWHNYISNALHYGGRPPRVELGATVQPDGRVRFWVRDNGEGIAPEEQEHLFVPFRRLQKGQERRKGHGLGLSITRRIVEKLGGEVGVESEVGQGSLFYFTLPQPKSRGPSCSAR
jgi:signal transduction histidine kinase